MLWMLGLGGAAAVAVAASCASSRERDLVGAGDAAQERTRATAGDTSRATVESGVDRFTTLFEAFEPHAVAAAALETYADDAYFNDGFVELEGNVAIAEYLRRSAESVDGFEADIEDVTVGDADAYVRWVMRFTVGDKTIVAPGISQLRFDGDGRVIYHRDHWDASAALAHFVPFVSRILEAVRSRL